MLLFTKNNNHTSAKLVSVNKTFCDSSSRTESLRRSAERLSQTTQVKPIQGKPLKVSDLNSIRHTLLSVRNVGGIPKKCSHLPSS